MHPTTLLHPHPTYSLPTPPHPTPSPCTPAPYPSFRHSTFPSKQMGRVLLLVGVVAACVALVSATCVKFCNHPNGRPGKYLCCDENPGRCPPVRIVCPAFEATRFIEIRPCNFDPECGSNEKCCFDVCEERTIYMYTCLPQLRGFLLLDSGNRRLQSSGDINTEHITYLLTYILSLTLKMGRVLLVVGVVAACVALVSATCVKFCNHPNGRPGKYLCCDENPGRCPPVREVCPEFGSFIGIRVSPPLRPSNTQHMSWVRLEMARMLLVVAVAAACVALVSASCDSFCQDPDRPRGKYLCCDEKPGRCPPQLFHCHGDASSRGDRPCHFDPECPGDLKCCLFRCFGVKICQIPVRH
ncbi:hypothetical protein Pmani_024881 [Petrolisthes manimaculis]|uniref:WAP domain-containing protein n=1 Tax=Petrolisthes manimaculis TaxID=1843537 RepID=A0AAE1U1R4_9EUCA|nr:hypothetical protein Pmani_024881 [Petrolisthes manimaculis]